MPNGTYHIFVGSSEWGQNCPKIEVNYGKLKTSLSPLVMKIMRKEKETPQNDERVGGGCSEW